MPVKVDTPANGPDDAGARAPARAPDAAGGPAKPPPLVDATVVPPTLTAQSDPDALNSAPATDSGSALHVAISPPIKRTSHLDSTPITSGTLHRRTLSADDRPSFHSVVDADPIPDAPIATPLVSVEEDADLAPLPAPLHQITAKSTPSLTSRETLGSRESDPGSRPTRSTLALDAFRRWDSGETEIIVVATTTKGAGGAKSPCAELPPTTPRGPFLRAQHAASAPVPLRKQDAAMGKSHKSVLASLMKNARSPTASPSPVPVAEETVAAVLVEAAKPEPAAAKSAAVAVPASRTADTGTTTPCSSYPPSSTPTYQGPVSSDGKSRGGSRQTLADSSSTRAKHAAGPIPLPPRLAFAYKFTIPSKGGLASVPSPDGIAPSYSTSSADSKERELGSYAGPTRSDELVLVAEESVGGGKTTVGQKQHHHRRASSPDGGMYQGRHARSPRMHGELHHPREAVPEAKDDEEGPLVIDTKKSGKSTSRPMLAVSPAGVAVKPEDTKTAEQPTAGPPSPLDLDGTRHTMLYDMRRPSGTTTPCTVSPMRSRCATNSAGSVNDPELDAILHDDGDDDARKKKAFDVQRYSVKAGGTLSRKESIKGDALLGSDHALHSPQGTHTNRIPSHVSLLNRLFHSGSSTHTADATSSPGSPVHGSSVMAGAGTASPPPGLSPHTKRGSQSNLFKKSGSFIEKLDKFVHPDHHHHHGANHSPILSPTAQPTHVSHLLASPSDGSTPQVPEPCSSGSLPRSAADASSTASPVAPLPAATQPQPETPSPRPMSPMLMFLNRKRSDASVAKTSGTSSKLTRSNSESSLHEKYGVAKEFLGKGANATVRLAHKVDHHHHGHHHGHHGHGHHGHGHHRGSEHHHDQASMSRGASSTAASSGSNHGTGHGLIGSETSSVASPGPNGSTLARGGSTSHHGSSNLIGAGGYGSPSAGSPAMPPAGSQTSLAPQGSAVEQLYAIKKFRKRRRDETERDYVKQVSSEFCISSSLHHPHVIMTVDLIQDEHDNWCEVMEYMPGGDLFSRIATGPPMSDSEINCLFAQLVAGVAYLHSVGVSHRDLKPENLLLDQDGRTLKIADFGTSEVYRVPWSTEKRKVKGAVGSDPYIAPEEWAGKPYDADKVDVWAVGIIYFVMKHKTIPWKAAMPNNPHYARYLETKCTGQFEYIEDLDLGPRTLLYKLLEPDPVKRIAMDEVQRDPWFQTIQACQPNHPVWTHSHSTGMSNRG
ncbi:HAL protein kinase [Allomyces macrogynus ATCC 38327]|uniref:non-specific serine/threonine protein kinase n=1 Tax=Allomyces macrogynus (strain ATCC 38327) TaxID=578462 RepID=A0A0L0RWS7_ALLM3|nr:HAL protein kinase [Allomyces macrogynus ATCC 38327]|eukprot:KNE54585.1 HAL protein kinase [Allomyces macrogynus ATCC 38327]